MALRKYKVTKIWYDEEEIVEANSEDEARRMVDVGRIYCDEIQVEEIEEEDEY
ncbi:MAG: hypothetical protein SPF36_07780 [Lachnospiraceae bacterium]|nr:hypothetical protein [Lachnospiraceae bacterium]